jgi:hypothetical protein
MCANIKSETRTKVSDPSSNKNCLHAAIISTNEGINKALAMQTLTYTCCFLAADVFYRN